jgi:NTE family protein
MDRGEIKRVNLALQGGGTHGAFGWGVLDKHIGHHSTVDLRSAYLNAAALHKEHSHA